MEGTIHSGVDFISCVCTTFFGMICKNWSAEQTHVTFNPWIELVGWHSKMFWISLALALFLCYIAISFLCGLGALLLSTYLHKWVDT